MSTILEEQETVVQFSRTLQTMTIYTSDTTVMTRLDKLYRCVKADTVDGKIVARTYEADKKFISFRTDAGYKPDYKPKRQADRQHIEKMLAARR